MDRQLTNRDYLIDSHCHLDFEAFQFDLDATINKAKKQGVERFIVPGIKAKQWSLLQQLHEQYSEIYTAIGIHPYFLNEYQADDLLQLEQMAQEPWVIAIGECGLDGFIASQQQTPNQAMKVQQDIFERHIEIANSVQKPLIVHHRKSHHHILQSFKRLPPQNGGVIHAFSGNLQEAKKYIELGFKLGCGGVISYERAAKTRATFSTLDLEHIVLETDSPDMPLAGFQGQRNEPAQVATVAKTLAQLKQIDVTEVAKLTTKNVERLFKLD